MVICILNGACMFFKNKRMAFYEYVLWTWTYFFLHSVRSFVKYYKMRPRFPQPIKYPKVFKAAFKMLEELSGPHISGSCWNLSPEVFSFLSLLKSCFHCVNSTYEGIGGCWDPVSGWQGQRGISWKQRNLKMMNLHLTGFACLVVPSSFWYLSENWPKSARCPQRVWKMTKRKALGAYL